MSDNNNELLEKYTEAVEMINREQQKIIGSAIAKSIMDAIPELNIKGTDLSINGDPKVALTKLVNGYATIFGKASIMVSKEAINKTKHKLLITEIPDILK